MSRASYMRSFRKRFAIVLKRWLLKRRIRQTGVVSSEFVLDYQHGLIEIGNSVALRSNGSIHLWGGTLTIGDSVSVNAGAKLIVVGTLTIGSGVRIGFNSVILSYEHVFDDIEAPIYEQGVDKRHTIIEEDVWIGANVTILGGVRIGKGSIVGANTCVTKDVPPFSIIHGPSPQIRNRFSKESV